MTPADWTRRARLALAPLLLALAPPAAAQDAPAMLSLEEAIALARRHNPEFLVQRNDEADADWAVREAWAGLLPGAAATGTLQYQAAGSQRYGIFTGDDIGFGGRTGYLLSSYRLGLSYRLGAETLLRPRQEEASRRAVRARIAAAGFALEARVTQRYIAVLRARDAVRLARQELERAGENLRLAEARVAVGAAIALEAKQAEVERGRAEVELLRAENLLETERLGLMETLGLSPGGPVELTTEFPAFEPDWSLESLVAMAMEAHPRLRALRATADAGKAAVRMARGQYLPTLELVVGWSGYTRQATNEAALIDEAHRQMDARRDNCYALNVIFARLDPPLPEQDCSGFALGAGDESAILARNGSFPFDFTREPLAAHLQVSLPLFNGFGRERRVEAARAAADDARHRLRGEALRLRTEVETAYRNVRTAHRAAELERRNAELAAEQLRLARERYAVGAISYVELLEAETIRARADRARLAAVYAFHEGLATLESAVGRRLHPTTREERP